MKHLPGLQQLQALLPFLAGLRWRYAAGALLLAVTNGCALLIPWLLKLAVETLRHPATGRLPIGFYAASIAAVGVVYALVRIKSRTTILHAARLVEFRLREALFDRLLSLDLSFYGRERTGDILSRFSNDLSNVRMLAGFGVMSLLNTAIIYLAAVWLMVRLSPWLTLVAVGPLPLMVLLVRQVSGRVFNLSREAQEELARLSSLAEETVSAVRVVKNGCREAWFGGLFDQASERCLKKNLDLARLRGLVVPIMAVATGGGTLAVLFVGGRQVIAGSMTLGDFVAFSGYLALLAWPTAVMGWVLTLTQRGAASMGRLDALLRAQSALVQTPHAPAASLGRGLELRQLSFAYGERRVLQALNCSIAAGERVGITGTVGSGKTTLLRLIAGLLPVGAGQLYLDGADVTCLSLGSVRRLSGYLPQEAFLFSRSISDNILYGGSGDARLCAGQAGLSHDLAGLKEGLATVVGERGIALSGGQRQRVALARALSRQPPLLLLDDPLAAVDAGREEEILDALAANWQGRTVLLVSQRLSAFRDCGRVLVLEEGRIVEDGPPAELLTRGGRYAALARLQQKSL